MTTINAWLSPVAGAALSSTAIIAYGVAVNAYGDADASGTTVDALEVLSLVAFAILVISPPGLGYVVSRISGAKAVGPVAAGIVIAAILALPALYFLSMANQCSIGDSFPIAGVEVCD